ncbi:MAG: polysaccharide deacetylase family protein [Dermatophilaceae bacterium]
MRRHLRDIAQSRHCTPARPFATPGSPSGLPRPLRSLARAAAATLIAAALAGTAACGATQLSPDPTTAPPQTSSPPPSSAAGPGTPSLTTQSPSADAALPAVTRTTDATVTIYGADRDAPGALLPMVATVHGARPDEQVAFAVAAASRPGTCEGLPWRHATGTSMLCWITLPSAAGPAQVNAAATLTDATGVARTEPGTYAVRAEGPPANAPTPQERDAISHCGHTSEQVWLTFDDGFTSTAALHSVVDQLTARHVKGRFFATGGWARANPQMVAAIRAQGHLVENHTSDHAWLHTLDDDALRTQIARGPASDDPLLLRPGYGAGAFTDRVRDTAARLGYQVCFWTVDPRDWAGPTADVILDRVLIGDEKTAPVAAGGVVLFHMTGAHTAQALPRVIDAIRAKGLILEPLP